MSVLSAKHFHDEEAAFAWVEARVWPEGPVCPHCGGFERIGKMGGKSTRLGTYKCYQCRKPFTVKVGTVFESSHVPLNIWLQAMHLICSSKKGISANQLHRILGVTLKTAWFMGHRIREAMRDGSLAPMGGAGGIVEADETFIGREPGKPKKRAYHHKLKVLSLVDRETGKARSMVVDDLKPATVVPILRENIAKETLVMTDEAGHYHHLSDDFSAHGVVRHGQGEYGIGEFHTNTIEGYFSVFKRGMKGVYQHCAKKHLHRYLAEFDFRYNNRSGLGCEDAERAGRALKGVVGKRLTYRRINA
ncbi:MAG TPA: IS1595 family transposase [Microvirga sp.]|jgi:transposase-like protein|nr:IS1595 family transposase [Microvirga sp.]